MKFIAIQWISGSGKTTLAQEIVSRNTEVFHIKLDWYFHEWEKIISMKNKEDIFAFDKEKFEMDIQKLKIQQIFTERTYDFTHKQSIVTRELVIPENSTIIIEWIHAFRFESIIGHYSQKIFLDTPIEIALVHRMKRDYNTTDPERKIKPIWEYLEYLEHYVIPSQHEIREYGRTQADIIIQYADNLKAIDTILQWLGMH